MIRHWKIIEGDFVCAPDIAGTWFVDPPYQVAGKHYVHTLSADDYARLALWCRDRKGQVMVCENEGADWLPFEPFARIKAGPANKVSAEVIWLQSQ
jgi:16S rRNA G966 N2-methylase RsmD